MERENGMKKYIIIIMIGVFLTSAVLCFGQESNEPEQSMEEFLQEYEGPGSDDYLMLLYEGSYENQILALQKLREAGTGGEEVVKGLIFGLHQGTFFVKRENNKVANDFWDVRAMSAQALGELAEPDDAQVLYELHMTLRYDPEPAVRSAAAAGLGKLGNKQSIYHLSRAIQVSIPGGQDDFVVYACVEAIGEIGAREGLVPLIEVMRGRFRRTIKIAARDALKKIEW